MGRQQASKIYKTKRYSRENDRILHEDLKDQATRHALTHQKFDEYLPGLGQHYCVPCAKHFENEAALRTHTKSKVHKRALKDIRFGPYTPEEAASGAGRDVAKFLAKQEQQRLLLAENNLHPEKRQSHLKHKPEKMAVEAEMEAEVETEPKDDEITV